MWCTVPLEHHRTVNSEWYTTICLPEVFNEIRNVNKGRKIIFHRDNASAHTLAETTKYLTGQNIELMGDLPYSLDLTPNDFFFPDLKNTLRGLQFSTPEEAGGASKTMFLYQNSEWQKGNGHLFNRRKSLPIIT